MDTTEYLIIALCDLFLFFFTKWYKSIYIRDPEVEPILNIKFYWATTTLGVSRQKTASGVNFEPPFWIEVITGSGSNSIPLPTFSWTT